MFQSSWTEAVERAVSSPPEEKIIESLIDIQLPFFVSVFCLYVNYSCYCVFHLHLHLHAVD